MTTISFVLNDSPIAVQVDPISPLVDVLRDDLGLTGTKRGCDYEGECGACTVLLDGQPVRSCLTPVGKVAGRSVLTVEGLGSPDRLHPLQQAFIETGAVQCGYCTPGMLLAAKALLDREPDPDREQIVEALGGNLCRCTGYTRVVMAVALVAARLRGDGGSLGDPPDEPVVGGDGLRTDSVAKVTGQARYVEDIKIPGMLHGAVLRSPHHHAQLVSLDVEKALCLPGVVHVLTAADVPGENGLSEYSSDEPVLTPVGTTVKMMGAPVALVVATSHEQAQAALEAIEVAFDPLPHTFDAREALREDAVPIREGGNVLSSRQLAHGDLEAAFAASAAVVETSYRTTFQEHAALEREAALGYIDEEGRVTVVAGTHEPHWKQGYIANALGLDPGQVRVIMPPTGGSFGGRQDPWPLVAAGLMAYHVRQAACLAYSRRESFDASPKRHPYRVKYRIGAGEGGHLTGIHVRIETNTGGYDAHGQYISNFALMASGGAYRYQAVDGYAKTVYTNAPKCGQFRGFGSPQSTFALECTLDELADALSEDPLALRLKNALRQSETSFLGYPVSESLGYVEVLEALRPRYSAIVEGVAAFNQAAREGAGDPALRKGVGLSGMWYRFGKSGALQVEAHAELTEDGHFVVYCSAPDYGQGTNTVMSQMAAESLGVSRERVEVVNADTALTPDSGIQGASRATYFVGGAVCRASESLKRSIQATAAEMLDRPPSDLALEEARVVSRSDPSVSIPLRDVAVRLCDVSPTGASTLVTWNLLNLTHRESHEHPTPLEPGTRYGVTVRLNAIAHSLPVGHRWRVAISPTYWPHAWPSPEPVTLTVYAGGESRLDLPVRTPQAEDRDLPEFAPPEGAAPPEMEPLAPGARERTVRHDVVTDRFELVDRGDRGHRRLVASGLEFGRGYTNTYTIVEGDPLSVSVRCDRTTRVGDGDWQVRVETSSIMTADVETFTVTNTLDAYEGETRVFAKTWDLKLDRDLV